MLTPGFNRTYAASPERAAKMAELCASLSDEVLGKTLVETIGDMLADVRDGTSIDDVVACAAIMVADIRAGERLRMGRAS